MFFNCLEVVSSGIPGFDAVYWKETVVRFPEEAAKGKIVLNIAFHADRGVRR